MMKLRTSGMKNNITDNQWKIRSMTHQIWRKWTFLCWKVIQFISALFVKIMFKVQIYTISS
jgi:hypothetical protein